MRYNKKRSQQPEPAIVRVRTPRANEKQQFGIVLAELGGTRFLCLCDDGKERICRVPGRLKRKVWIHEGNYVILIPWEIEGDKKGDIVWRYKPLEVEWLKKKGYLKNF